MGYLLAVPVSDGAEPDGVVVFEVDLSEVSADLEFASDEPGVAARARRTLEQALTDLRPSLRRVVGMVRDLAPSQATVEFGIKMGGETGVIVAKGTAEANFTITLSWTADRVPDV